MPLLAANSVGGCFGDGLTENGVAVTSSSSPEADVNEVWLIDGCPVLSAHILRVCACKKEKNKGRNKITESTGILELQPDGE